MVDMEGTIIGENKANSEAFVRAFGGRLCPQVSRDGAWHYFDIPYIKDIRGEYTGNWLITSSQIWGDGGYWLNGSSGITVRRGWVELRKCCDSDQCEIGSYYVQYTWQDNIDANSFQESWDTIRQGNIGAAIEAIYDLLGDKILDLDYSVSIDFDDEGELAEKTHCR